MRWPWSKKNTQNELAGNGQASKSAVVRAESGKKDAEKRWRDVNQVTDDFAIALEKALRRTR